MAQSPPDLGSQEAIKAATAAVDAARRSWESGVSEARRQLASAEKAHGKEIDKQEKAIEKRRRPKVLGGVGTVTLYDDHIQVGGRQHPLRPGVTATVEVGSKDKVFLRLQGPEWSEVVELDDKREAKARSVAADLEVAASNAERATAARSADVAHMEQALVELRVNAAQVDEARQALTEAQADTASLKSAGEALDAQIGATADTTTRTYRQAIARLGKARAAAGIPAPVGSKAAAAFAAGEGSAPFWRTWMSGWRLAVAGVSAALVVIIIIATVLGGGGNDDQEQLEDAAAAPTGVTTSTASTPAAATSTPAPKAKPRPKPKPKPVDTGRMSDGEFERAITVIADVQKELGEYRQQISNQCSLMFQAGQVAEGFDCVNDAYKGVEDEIVYAYSTMDDLTGQTGKACQRVTRVIATTLNRPLYQSAKASKAALDAVDASLIAASSKALITQEKRLDTYSIKMLGTCAPK